MGKYKVKLINSKQHICNNKWIKKRVWNKTCWWYIHVWRKTSKKYTEFINNEFEIAGFFDEQDELMGFVSYKITPDGLLGDNILVFEKFRGKVIGTLLRHLEAYARKNNCKQIYFGARRSANQFYFKLGFEGSCLIQSDKATKEDLEKILLKYGIKDYSYNLYTGCNPLVNQIRVDAKFINNSELLDEIDNSDLDIGCILTFSKKIETNKNIKKEKTENIQKELL